MKHSQEQRRRFLKMLSAGGAGAILPGCGFGDASESAPEASAFFKDTAPFIAHGAGNLEARLENMGGFLTPAEQFFVRNNDVSLDLDAASYRLEIAGDAVANTLTLTYKDLRAMPHRTVFSIVECAGNHRAFFGAVMGRPARGTPWGTGAIGMAVWTGVPLTEVLRRAGVQDSAVDVHLIGLDKGAPEGGFRRPIPIAKAMDPDTLLATHMNGAALPRDHGYPVRAIVPGWVGSSSIKWLGRIEVSTEKVWGRNNTTSYVRIGDAYPEGGEVVTEQSIKSALALSWGANLQIGRHRIRGYAHSPHAPIATVQWSLDEGATWRDARVMDSAMRYAWERFEIEWEATPGEHRLMTRATDRLGNTQPDTIPYNEKGYLFNAPLPHPITVT